MMASFSGIIKFWNLRLRLPISSYLLSNTFVLEYQVNGISLTIKLLVSHCAVHFEPLKISD